METDEEFYRLGTEFPEALVGLVRGARPEGGYSMRSLTVKDVERRLDLCFEPERPGDRWWLVEVSGWADRQVERRLFRKAVAVAEDHDLWGKLRTGVVYLHSAHAQDVLPPTLGPPELPIALQPVRVFLDAMTPARLLRLSPELFPLLPLCRVKPGGLASHLSRWWRWVTGRLGHQPERIGQQRDLLCRFYLARHPDAILKEVRELLENVMKIEHTRAGQELIQIGEERGIQIGEERGIQIGDRRARLDSIRRLLESRFGTLPARIVERLEGLESVERLKDLFEAALEARDLEDFARQL